MVQCGRCGNSYDGFSCPHCAVRSGQAAQASAMSKQTGVLAGGLAANAAANRAGFQQMAGAMTSGFNQLDGRLEHLGALQQQGLALSQQQLGQLEAMRAEQARRFAEEQARLADQARVQAMYGNAAGLLHDSLLAAKTLERKLAAPETDALVAWVQLELVSRRTSTLDPGRVDPAQRRDLVELRDNLQRCAELIEKRIGQDREEARRWIGLIAEQKRLRGSADGALHYLTSNRQGRGVTIAPPRSVAEAAAQIEAAETRLSELRAAFPEPLPPSVQDALAQIMGKGNPPHPAQLSPEALATAGRTAHAALMRLADPKERRPLSWAPHAMVGIALCILAGVFFFGGLALLGASGIGGLIVILLAIVPVAMVVIGSGRANTARFQCVLYTRWVAMQHANIMQADTDLADLRWVREVLAHTDTWEAGAQGGGAIQALRQWRPDLEQDVQALALLN